MNRVGIPIPPHEDQAALLRNAVQETVQHLTDLLTFDSALMSWIWDTLLHFLRQRNNIRITLGSIPPIQNSIGTEATDLS